jgi:hypothetical protein
MTRSLLMVAHCPSDNTRKLWHSVSEGVSSISLEKTQFKALSPFDTKPEDVLNADAIILGTTENLAYMSGALKVWSLNKAYLVLHLSGLAKMVQEH